MWWRGGIQDNKPLFPVVLVLSDKVDVVNTTTKPEYRSNAGERW